MWAGEEKSLVVACFIIEIKEEFQRQSPGKGIFSQVRAVAFLVLMQRFRVETWQGGGRKGEISVSGIGCSQYLEWIIGPATNTDIGPFEEKLDQGTGCWNFDRRDSSAFCYGSGKRLGQ